MATSDPTQSTAIFTESAHYLLIQNSSFGHAANGDDNSYNLRLWGSDGSIVSRNRVWDSRYWGGGVNSHGITFMVAGDEADIWVCENEVFDSIGRGVSTKNGSSNVHIVGNYFHDLGTAIHTSNYRCDRRGCDDHLFPGGGYTVRENLFLLEDRWSVDDDRNAATPATSMIVAGNAAFAPLVWVPARGQHVPEPREAPASHRRWVARSNYRRLRSTPRG